MRFVFPHPGAAITQILGLVDLMMSSNICGLLEKRTATVPQIRVL
jgi:hypothetical protein